MENPNTYMTKAEMARRHIQSMILSGSVGPGDRITTREVSTALGISETPIREAIRGLASEGWLEVQSHIGAVVQGLRTEQIREISALRGRVCSLAIELGAPNFDAERLAMIDDNIKAYAKALQRKDYDLVAEYKLRVSRTPLRQSSIAMVPQAHRKHAWADVGPAAWHSAAAQPSRRSTGRAQAHPRHAARGAIFAGAADMVMQHEKNTGDFLIQMISEMPETAKTKAGLRRCRLPAARPTTEKGGYPNGYRSDTRRT